MAAVGSLTRAERCTEKVGRRARRRARHV